MSKTAGLHIASDGLGALVSMPKRLAHRITDMAFYSIIPKTGFRPGLGIRRVPSWK